MSPPTRLIEAIPDLDPLRRAEALGVPPEVVAALAILPPTSYVLDGLVAVQALNEGRYSDAAWAAAGSLPIAKGPKALALATKITRYGVNTVDAATLAATVAPYMEGVAHAPEVKQAWHRYVEHSPTATGAILAYYLQAKYGATVSVVTELVAIAHAESGWNAYATSPPNQPAYLGRDRGLWQINDHHHTIPARGKLDPYDARQATDYAMELVMSDKGLEHWHAWSAPHFEKSAAMAATLVAEMVSARALVPEGAQVTMNAPFRGRAFSAYSVAKFGINPTAGAA